MPKIPTVYGRAPLKTVTKTTLHEKLLPKKFATGFIESVIDLQLANYKSTRKSNQPR